MVDGVRFDGEPRRLSHGDIVIEEDLETPGLVLDTSGRVPLLVGDGVGEAAEQDHSSPELSIKQ